MNRILQILITFLIFMSCNKDDISAPIPENENSTFISAVDISSYTEISNSNPTFYSGAINADYLMLQFIIGDGLHTIYLI